MVRRRTARAALCLLVALVQVASLVTPVFAQKSSGGFKIVLTGSDDLKLRVQARALAQRPAALESKSAAPVDQGAIPAPRQATLQTLSVKTGQRQASTSRKDARDTGPAAQAVRATEFAGDPGGQVDTAPPKAQLVGGVGTFSTQPAPRRAISGVIAVRGNSPLEFKTQPATPAQGQEVVRQADVVMLPVRNGNEKGDAKTAAVFPSGQSLAVKGGGLATSSRQDMIKEGMTTVGEAEDIQPPAEDEAFAAELDAASQRPLGVKEIPATERPDLPGLRPVGGARRTGKVERQGAGAAGEGGGLPDLIVELKAKPAVLKPRETFTLDATVKNAGDGPSQDTQVTFFLAASTQDQGRQVSADSVASLAGGGVNPRYEQLFEAPERAGTYYLVACVQNVSTEKKLDNNVVRIPIEVTQGKPDLAIDATLAPESVLYGQPLEIEFKCDNLGDDVAAESKLRLGISKTEDCKEVRPIDTREAAIEVRPLGIGEGTSPGLRIVRFGRPMEPGKYYLCASVDPVAKETVLDNNRKVVPFEVKRPIPPDLQARITLSAAEIEAGGGVTADVFITNVGQGDSSAVEAVFVQAPDSGLANRDVKSRFQVSPLKPLATIAKRFPVNIRGGTPPQTIHLGVIADRAQDEEFIDNNRDVKPLAIKREGQPDLKASVLDVEPGAVRQGEEFRTRIRIENIGRRPAAGTRYELTLAPSGNRSQRMRISNDGLGALNPGQLVETPATNKIQVKVPSTVPPGEYVVVLEVEPVADERAPTDLTANNRDENRIQVKEQTRPDLAVDLKAADHRVKAGGSTTASILVKNLGNRDAGRSRLSLLLARTADGPGAIIKEVETPALPPGAEFPLAANVAIRGDAPLGGYFLVALVEPVVGEVNLTNNRATDCLDVIEPDVPELECRVNPATGKTCPGGETFRIQIETKNTGKGGSPATRGRLLIGREKDLRDASEQWAGPIPALPPGGSVAGASCSLDFKADAWPGKYFFAFVVDTVKGEKNAENNRAPGEIEVCDPGRPDLAIRLALSRNRILAREAVEGEVEIENLGTSKAAASKAILVFHTSTNVARGQGLELASLDVPELDRGAKTSKLPIKLQLEAGTRPGMYYLHSVVDAVKGELNLANNRAFRSIEVAEPPPPDLVAKLSIEPRRQRSGLKVVARLKISNDGPSGAPASVCNLVLSRDEALRDAKSLHQDQVPALGPGGSLEKTVEFAVPPDAVPGQYTVGLKVTPVPREEKINNNTDRRPLIVEAPPKPDLVARITLNELTVLQGQRVTGRLRFSNEARETPTPASRYHLRAARDEKVTDARDVTGPRNDVPALKAGDGEEVPFVIEIDPNQEPGTYALRVDADGVPDEETLVNNHDTAVFAVECAPPPDLLAVLKLSRDRGHPGDEVTATMKVQNVGRGMAAAGLGRLVLAHEPDLSDGRALLREPIKIPALGANEGNEYTHTFRIDPVCQCGNDPWYVGWIVERVPREENLANNRDAKSLLVEKVPRADLVANVATIRPDPVGRRETLTVAVEVANAGDGKTSPSKARLLAATRPDFSDAIVLSDGVEVPALEPGFTAAGSATYRVDDVPAGTGVIYAKLDVDKVAEEDRVDNNTDKEFVRYELHEYNVKVHFVTDPLRQKPGLSAVVRVVNEGPFGSPEGTLRVALSPSDPTGRPSAAVGAGEKEIAGQPVPALKPGESKDYPIKTDEDPARYRAAVARIEPGVLDTNPLDNADERGIPGGPRLAVHPSPIQLVHGICKGQREVQVRVCNIGQTDLQVNKITKEKGGAWFQHAKDRLDAIAPEGCSTFLVTLVAQALSGKEDNDALVFVSNDPGQKELRVQVGVGKTGEAPPKPDDKVECRPGEVEVVAGSCRSMADFGILLAAIHGGTEQRYDVAGEDATWTAAKGSIGAGLKYCAPDEPGDDELRVKVRHCEGQEMAAVVRVKVKPAPAKCTKVFGRVHTQTNAGVEGVQIEGLPGPSVQTGKDGTYEVACVPSGEYTLVASLPVTHPLATRAKAKLEPPRRIVKVKDADERVEPFTLVLPSETGRPTAKCLDRCIVRGKLKDPKGEPAHGYKIRAVHVSAAGEETSSEEGLTDRDKGGGFSQALERKGGVCAGDKIRFKVVDPEGKEASCEPSEIELAEGQDRVEIELAVAGGSMAINLPCAGAHLITVPLLVKDRPDAEWHAPTAYTLWKKLRFTALIGTSYIESQRRTTFSAAVPQMVKVDGAKPGEAQWDALNLRTYLLEPGRAYIVIVPCGVNTRIEGKALEGPVRIQLRKGLNLIGMAKTVKGKHTARGLARRAKSKTMLRLGCVQQGKHPFERIRPDTEGRGMKMEPGQGFMVDAEEDHVCDLSGKKADGGGDDDSDD